MAVRPVLFFSILWLTSTSVKADTTGAVILGAETHNEFKQIIVQSLIPEADVYDNFDSDTFILYLQANANDGLKSLESDFLKKVVSSHDQWPNVVVATKAVEQMSLEEIQLFGEIMYQINSGVAVVMLGPPDVLTDTLVEQSAFCWARSQLRAELRLLRHQVLLCNGARASSLSILESRARPLHDLDTAHLAHFEDLALPEPRPFWPSLFVSAEPDKKAKSKKTNQRNVRKDRVYGKEKKSEDKLAEQTPHEPNVKLACKYRKSCYEGKPPPTAEEIQQKYGTPAETETHASSALSKEQNELDQKLKCKYRTDCYKQQGIEEKKKGSVANDEEEDVAKDEDEDDGEVEAEVKKVPENARHAKSAEEEDVAKDEDEDDGEVEVKKVPENARPAKSAHSTDEDVPRTDVDDKVACKYRKSCYATGELTEEALRTRPPTHSTPTPADVVDVEQLDEAEKRVQCKYRKSCYETGQLDVQALHAQPAQPPRVHAQHVDVEESTSEADRKLKCKYRKNCYETGIVEIVPAQQQHVQVKDEPTEDFEDMEEERKKVFCKYRKSCYETGKLNAASLQASPPKSEPEPTKDFEEMEELEQKVHCKYRKSCYETGQVPKDLTTSTPIQENSDEPTSGLTPELKCKYRKSCYESGKLPKTLTQTQTVEVVEQPKTTEADQKLACKYRKNCYAQEVKEEASEEETDEETEEDKEKETEDQEENDSETEEEPEIVVVDRAGEEATEPDDESSEEENDADEGNDGPQPTKQPRRKIKVPEKVEVVIEEPKGKKAVERRKQNPDRRFVSKFKKVGNYEQLPKTAEEDDDDEDEEVEEETEQVPDDVEEATDEEQEQPVHVVLTESEPIVEEPDDEQEDETAAEDDDKEGDEEGEGEGEADSPKIREMESNEDDSDLDITVPPEDRLSCKYRKSCYRTGKIDPNASKRPSRKESVDDLPRTVHGFRSLNELDRKLACKYRKSCYDSGVLHLEPGVQHVAADENVVMVGLDELDELDKKLACKYRKSCYESGRLELRTAESPSDDVIQPTVVHLAALGDADRKLACKYRKSCYEDGVLRAHQTVAAPTVLAEARTEADYKLQCKYRKSCYEKRDNQEAIQAAVEREKTIVVEMKPEKKSKKKDKKTEKAVEPVVPVEPQQSMEDKADDVDRPPESNHTVVLVDSSKLSSDAKLVCKYRQSCYGQASEATVKHQPQARVKFHGDKCNKYWLSCREKLGLPAKEKVPRGKDGRKLCRKRKPKEMS